LTILAEEKNHVFAALMPQQIIIFSHRADKLFVSCLDIERYLREVGKVGEIKMAVCCSVILIVNDHLLEMKFLF
jgi:hypothetical protein